MVTMRITFVVVAVLFVSVPLTGISMLNFSSKSFKNGGTLSKNYTCYAQNISPHLQWKKSRNSEVKSYVLIVDDPDAQRVVGKTFVHWIVILPAHVHELIEGISRKDKSTIPGYELRNDSGTKHYAGACPPKGTGVHSYRFTLFALNQEATALQKNSAFPKAPFTAEQFNHTMATYIVGHDRIVGRYGVE